MNEYKAQMKKEITEKVEEQRTKYISEIEKEITLGLIYPEKNTTEDKISESPIRPIVGGSFIYLKFIYISKAESVTNIDDISNTFIGYYK